MQALNFEPRFVCVSCAQINDTHLETPNIERNSLRKGKCNTTVLYLSFFKRVSHDGRSPVGSDTHTGRDLKVKDLQSSACGFRTGS